MPFDKHLLIACIAPRALLVEGFDDGWFDWIWMMDFGDRVFKERK